MWAYKEPYNFGPGKNTQQGDKTSGNDGQEKEKITVSQLFVSGDVRYRKIYVTANAGFGKTSLSQKLTMTWCQSHFPLKSLKKKYKGEELHAMKYFDFVFLLHLRDYPSDSKCNLDDLIMEFVSGNLSRKSQYTNEFIERILQEKKCLVILDGLDEWAHPGHCPRKTRGTAQ
jgi:predicted NACHT family NTPase